MIRRRTSLPKILDEALGGALEEVGVGLVEVEGGKGYVALKEF